MRWLLFLLLPITLGSSTLELVTPARAIRHIHLTPRGVASYYAPRFDGKIARDGSVYHHRGLTAASNAFPMGTTLMVCREDRPWRCVQVRVTDTGQLYGRLLDLSGGAARKLGMLHEGLCLVTVRE